MIGFITVAGALSVANGCFLLRNRDDLSGKISRIAGRLFCCLAIGYCGSVLPSIALMGIVIHWIQPESVNRVLMVLNYLFTWSWGMMASSVVASLLVLPATVCVAAFTSGVALKLFISSDCVHWIHYFFS